MKDATIFLGLALCLCFALIKLESKFKAWGDWWDIFCSLAIGALGALALIGIPFLVVVSAIKFFSTL